jgi:hypothetical protein
MKNLITFITRPLQFDTKSRIYGFLRSIKNKSFLFPPNNKYDGGHSSVCRSYDVGLSKLGINYNFNPLNINDIGDKVVVLSNSYALRQVLELRDRLDIAYLCAGPNVCTTPNTIQNLAESPSLDKYFVNSIWTYNMYSAILPSIKPKLAIIPAGFDDSYWVPDSSTVRRLVLIYSKDNCRAKIRQVSSLCNILGYESRIIAYGSYTMEEYKDLLAISVCLVYLTSTPESQGLALFEAWATDTPTFVEYVGFYRISGNSYYASSAPYLTDTRGDFFRSLSELHFLLSRLSLATHYSPSTALSAHYSDTAVSSLLLNELHCSLL